MRMRKLGKGQSVVFCVPNEIQATILERTSKKQGSDIAVSDILTWAISETWADLRRSIPLWATQGRRSERHKNLLNGANTTTKQAEQFLDDEAQSVEFRYRPRPHTQSDSLSLEGWDTSNANIARIIERCQDFETTTFDSATLLEEQERELSPEIEEERQVQRPPSMEAETHGLHPDLLSSVDTGEIRTGSNAFIPAFEALHSTSAVNQSGVPPIPETLLVTTDFMRTVKQPSGILRDSSVLDSYLRPVQWILSASKSTLGVHTRRLAIISPFEADKLVPGLRKSKTTATLHLYSPRPNLAYKPLDRLDLYCVGSPYSASSIHTITRSDILQLNLFAGQQYFDSYEEYIEMCEYLGLGVTTAMEGQIVLADGFVLPPMGKWMLKESPIRFLRELMKIRRDGEEIVKTHLGKVLNGVLLGESDFE